MITVDSPITRCPKCEANRPDGAVECVRCGIVFAKYRPLDARVSLPSSARSSAGFSWAKVARDWLIEADKTTDKMTFYGRAVVLLALIWWGCRFIVTPLETNYTGESFLHLINLPFHEAGHLIFMPFGRFTCRLASSTKCPKPSPAAFDREVSEASAFAFSSLLEQPLSRS